MFKINPVLATDSYKLGHMVMYPEGTTKVYSNFTPRSTKHSPIPAKYNDHKIVTFGTQATVAELDSLWKQHFFNVPWKTVEEELRTSTAPFVGDSGFEQGIRNFHKLHTLGFLPIRVKALEEGSVVDAKIPMYTIENTLPAFFWLVGYLETYLSQESWKTATVATLARAYRKILTQYATETGVDPSFVDIQAHDFSSRGLSGAMDNAKTGAGHLTSFIGTDSLLAADFVKEFYVKDTDSTLVGVSVPATEHSVMTSGTDIGEYAMFERVIDMYPTGVVSIVADSYDFWDVMTNFTVKLKDKILARQPDSLGLSKVVFRPDSGDPVDIICGTAIPITNWECISNPKNYPFKLAGPNNPVYQEFDVVYLGTFYSARFKLNRDHSAYQFDAATPYAPEAVTPEMKGAVDCLWDVFGGTTNEAGYKELNQSVGLIYGDSITMSRADQILSRLKDKGYASNNIVLGVGSYSYQYLTRDTFGFAMKSTYQEVNGQGINIFKDPKTDDGTKKSATGLLQVTKHGQTFTLRDKVSPSEAEEGELRIIYQDGKFDNLVNIDKIRENIRNSL